MGLLQEGQFLLELNTRLIPEGEFNPNIISKPDCSGTGCKTKKGVTVLNNGSHRGGCARGSDIAQKAIQHHVKGGVVRRGGR